MHDPTTHPTPETTSTADEALSYGFIIDVLAVLDRHGYQRADDRALGATVGHLHALVRAYQGGDQ